MFDSIISDLDQKNATRSTLIRVPDFPAAVLYNPTVPTNAIPAPTDASTAV